MEYLVKFPLIVYRIRVVTRELATRGHNVTSMTADIDTEFTPNLHYLHLDRVYDTLYASADRDLNYVDIGALSPWRQFSAYHDYSVGLCEGAVISKGWQQLLNYPDDFKVNSATSSKATITNTNFFERNT